MDIFDQAQELEMLQREASLKKALEAPKEGPFYTGKCHYCEEAVHVPRRFCDGECREGWEKLMAAKARNGTPCPAGAADDTDEDSFGF